MSTHDLSARVLDHLRGSAKTFAAAETCLPQILDAAAAIAECFRSGGKLLLCGNGGSAADCQHFAAEFMSRLTKDRDRAALPAIALTTDSSFLTAYGNDIGFDGIFMRQVEALGKKADVLFCISTSGESVNILKAVEAAKKQSVIVIALTGGAGGKLGKQAKITIAIPSKDTQGIQEVHLAVEHIICDLVECMLFE